MSDPRPLDRIAELFAHGESPPSRNAAFDAYRNKHFAAAMRLHRHLRTLADDVVVLHAKAGASLADVVEVARDDDRFSFRYTLNEVRREAFVLRAELDVLFFDDKVAVALLALGLTPSVGANSRDDDVANDA